MTKMNFVKKLTAVGVAAVALGASQTALATQTLVWNTSTFAFNERTGVPSSYASVSIPGFGTFTAGSATSGNANSILGSYDEFLSFSGTATGGTFTTSAVYNVSSLLLNGSQKSGGIGTQNFDLGAQTNAAMDYQMYAVFKSGGTYSVDASGNHFSATSGSYSLWVDPAHTSIVTAPGSNGNPATPSEIGTFITSDLATVSPASGVTVGSLNATAQGSSAVAGDYLLAYSDTMLQGGGNSTPGSSGNGSFNLYFNNFTKTTAGNNYFTGAMPSDVQVTGSFDDFNIPTNGGQATKGSATTYFGTAAFVLIPEPGTMALAGLGVLVAGAASRRRKH